jgi:hypothetical protein
MASTYACNKSICRCAPEIATLSPLFITSDCGDRCHVVSPFDCRLGTERNDLSVFFRPLDCCAIASYAHRIDTAATNDGLWDFGQQFGELSVDPVSIRRVSFHRSASINDAYLASVRSGTTGAGDGQRQWTFQFRSYKRHQSSINS